jgi:hypothetical protein
VTASSPDPGRPEDPNPLLSLLRRCVLQVHASEEFVGTAFFVAPGEILTCAHVTHHADEITVAWDGGSSAATLVKALPPIDVGDPAAAFYPFPDVALLRLTNPPEGHPCVRLDTAEPAAGLQPDLLHLRGFTKGERARDEVGQSPAGLKYEGPVHEPGGRVFKLKGGQVIGGFSGSPLLNLRTGRVCALVDSSRNERSDLGGFGIPVTEFLQQLLGLADRNQAHHQTDPTWDAAVEAEQRLATERDWAGARRPLGRPIDELTDPFALEVHRAIDVPGTTAVLPVLPAYVERDHDRTLRALVQQAAEGRSTAVVLVGGSSTGKTRACWEAVHALPRGWRLWHPIDPSRPDAAADALAAVGPSTVIWLNEAQHYLLTRGSDLGERVAAGLRELLRDPGRAPVLLLGTIWPEYWATLTTPPARDQQDDPHAQARALLIGTDLAVSEAFTGPSLRALRAAAKVDPRLDQAATHAEDGRITQFLAGAPALLERYRAAPSAARALIEAAMDARRLGHGPYLPYGFLEAAAPAYLTEQQWDELGDDWLEQSLAYCADPARGARGPLTRVRPRPGQPPHSGPQYRLADYLEQIGRTTRQVLLPPPALWDARSWTMPSRKTLFGSATKQNVGSCSVTPCSATSAPLQPAAPTPRGGRPGSWSGPAASTKPSTSTSAPPQPATPTPWGGRPGSWSGPAASTRLSTGYRPTPEPTTRLPRRQWAGSWSELAASTKPSTSTSAPPQPATPTPRGGRPTSWSEPTAQTRRHSFVAMGLSPAVGLPLSGTEPPAFNTVSAYG